MAKKVVRKKTEEVAGRGKKKCVCGAILGIRVKVCPECSHEFSFQTKDKSAAKAFKKSSGGRLNKVLMDERDRIEEMLANKEQLEERLRRINELLETV